MRMTVTTIAARKALYRPLVARRSRRRFGKDACLRLESGGALKPGTPLHPMPARPRQPVNAR
jgi:hypothetical protein